MVTIGLHELTHGRQGSPRYSSSPYLPAAQLQLSQRARRQVAKSPRKQAAMAISWHITYCRQVWAPLGFARLTSMLDRAKSEPAGSALHDT
ncbi:uncharacterized protein B0I36DRAFT_316884 [Microdochium trichocladiopsis]|uniref:Uncharacterized protein n=1 Tax=Microdochium trichocladiopsis TaxID=1682393 RepID=A0A9P8YDB0_9PEZI|nr:uncharacterized protein B0I36DRAFT_316884 [Microdochium trichocladiopsis]KAH7034752.1 hypothetical protein B0I36DRAFT_316884 [Microdochium trichocladiopsis]